MLTQSDLDLTLVCKTDKHHHLLLKQILDQFEAHYPTVNAQLNSLYNCYVLGVQDSKFPNVKVDLTINSTLAVQQAQLIKAYTLVRKDFRWLAVYLKAWNHC